MVYPEGPSTQYLRTLIPKAVVWFLGTEPLNIGYWTLWDMAADFMVRPDRSSLSRTIFTEPLPTSTAKLTPAELKHNFSSSPRAPSIQTISAFGSKHTHGTDTKETPQWLRESLSKIIEQLLDHEEPPAASKLAGQESGAWAQAL